MSYSNDKSKLWGIIAAIAIPAYRGYIQESRYGTALQDMRQMQLILDDLASDNDLGAIAARIARMATAIMISISVKPAWR